MARTWIIATVAGKGQILTDVPEQTNLSDLVDGTAKFVPAGHIYKIEPVGNSTDMAALRQKLGWKTDFLPMPDPLQIVGFAGEMSVIACPLYAVSEAPGETVEMAKKIWRMMHDGIKAAAAPGAPKIDIASASTLDQINAMAKNGEGPRLRLEK